MIINDSIDLCVIRADFMIQKFEADACMYKYSL